MRVSGNRGPRILASLLVASVLLAALFMSRADAASPTAFVKWRFEVDGQYILHRPAVAPDGNVAVASSSGRLYSLTPLGALRWSVPAVGGDGGPSIGPDGTVYVGRDNRVTAVAPDGTIRWTFVDSGQSVMAGPTVGPDGNIYVVFDIGGLGAVALSPAGQLLWSNPGNPTFLEYGQLGAEIVFDSESLYVAFDEFGVAPTSMLYRLTLDGTQDWAVPVPTSNDVFMQRQAQPAIGPDGALYLTGLNSQQGWLLVRFNRDSGSVVWTYTRRSGERDVAARGRTGRVGLPLEKPRLPRRRQPSRRRTLDVLRRVDHRLSGRDAERRARRRRRPAELRRAGQAARLERGQRGARLPGRAPDRRQRLPGRLHGTSVHAGQYDGLCRNRDVLSP